LAADAVEGVDDAFEGFLFLAQGLGALGIVPDAWIFEQLGDFF